MPLRIIVFDVQHGFCAFVKTPTRRTLLIDCGKSNTFSPVEYVVANELHDVVPYESHLLTELIVSHPHNDHVEDIEALIAKLPPRILHRQRYSWDELKESSGADYLHLESYAKWQETYSVTRTILPDWGVSLDVFRLIPEQAAAVDEAKYVNNSSMVVLISWAVGNLTWKFLFGGDMEEAGWTGLLQKDTAVRPAIRGTDVYITSHHGHSSGFSADLFEAMGCPFINVVSAKEGDESVDGRYSSETFAKGLTVNGEMRRMLSTRNDGSVVIDVSEDARWRVTTCRFGPNIQQRAGSSGLDALRRSW